LDEYVLIEGSQMKVTLCWTGRTYHSIDEL